MPEQPAPQPAPAPQATPTNNVSERGKSARLFGILGLVFTFLPIVPLLGLIFSIIAVVKAGPVLKENPADSAAKAGKIMGWIGIVLGILAFLVLLLMFIGMFAFFGVMEPSNFLPDTCSAGAEFGCTQHAFDVTTNTISATFVNSVGSDLEDVSVSAFSRDCTFTDDTQELGTIASGERFDVSFMCADDVDTSYFAADFEIGYRPAGQTYGRQSMARVATNIN